MREKMTLWNLQALGQKDFSDIIGLWQEALDEFKAAAVTSFTFWNDIAELEPGIEADDETLSYALELEKSLKAVAGTSSAARRCGARGSQGRRRADHRTRQIDRFRAGGFRGRGAPPNQSSNCFRRLSVYGARATPFSVMIAVTRSFGVTSNA